MTLTNDSLFESLHITFNDFGDPHSIDFQLVGETQNRSIQWRGPEAADSGADWATLLHIYSRHEGFPGAMAGDSATLITPTVENLPHRHRTFGLLADYGEQYADPFLTERRGGGGTTQDGTAMSGPKWVQAVLWQRAATAPNPASFDVDGMLTYNDWHPSRDVAVASVSGSDPVWLCTCSATQDSAGNWNNNPSHVTQEWGVEYSEDGATNWHRTATDEDAFIRYRLADGTYAQIRIKSDADGRRVWFWPENEIRGNSGSSLIGINFSTPVEDIDLFNVLGFSYFPRSGYASGNIGRVHEALVVRPYGGWHVNNTGREFEVVYRQGHSLTVTTKVETVALPRNETAYNSNDLVRSLYCRMKANGLGLNRRGGRVDGVTLAGLGSGYLYASFRMFGLVL